LRFSRRTAWTRALNPIAERLEQRRQSGATWIDLTESNPTRCEFRYPVDEIAAALCTPPLESYEPEPRGSLSAREAVVRYLSSKGARVSASEVVLCAGTSEAYSYLFKLLCDPGDNVLVPQPSYPLFDFLVGMEGLETRPYSAFDLRSVVQASDLRTRAVVAVSPATPTGTFLKRAEFELLDRLCAANSWSLIVDEVFSDYAWAQDGGAPTTVLAWPSCSLLFSLSGLSKVAGLPQLKLSWLAARGEAGLLDEALARLDLVADSYLSVNNPVQRALPKLLELAPAFQRQVRERLGLNREVLISLSTNQSRWRLLPGEGGWFAAIEIGEGLDEDSTCLALLDRGVLVHPGYFFDFPRQGYLVLSMLPPGELFARGAQSMSRLLDDA